MFSQTICIRFEKYHLLKIKTPINHPTFFKMSQFFYIHINRSNVRRKFQDLIFHTKLFTVRQFFGIPKVKSLLFFRQFLAGDFFEYILSRNFLFGVPSVPDFLPKLLFMLNYRITSSTKKIVSRKNTRINNIVKPLHYIRSVTSTKI